MDGCFWHGHDCRNTRPKDNADYWAKKLERNIKRDNEVTQVLQEKKWTVIRLWECELKNADILNERLLSVITLSQNERFGHQKSTYKTIEMKEKITARIKKAHRYWYYPVRKQKRYAG